MTHHSNNSTRDTNPDLPAPIEHLKTSYHRGAISRRSFIQGAVALGLSLTAASSLLNQANAATPKSGGRLRTAITGGSTTDVLDPGQSQGLYMNSLHFGHLQNCLTEISASGELIPELAESWQVSSDAKNWTLKIRRGVEFHNGKTLEASDVVATLRHHIRTNSTSAARGILADIENVKAEDKHTVTVSLSGGDADFPYLLSDYHLGICPANADGSADVNSGLGTGGYVLTEHDPGVRTLCTRFANYWKPERAHFAESELVQVTDSNARSTALRTDAVDCMSEVDVKTVSRLKQIEGIVVKSTTGNQQITLPMRTNTAPFDDEDVRLALKYCIDREQWLQKIAYGYGQIGNDNPIGPANIYRATEDELPQREYSTDHAKFHLRKARQSNLKIKFHAANTGFAGAVDAAQLLRENALPAGIDIEVVRVPEDGYWTNFWRKVGFCASNWSGRPTENWIFSQIYATDAKWNETAWKNKRFNKLLIRARAELDTSKRREMYVKMQRILHREGGLILPLFISDVLAHTTAIQTPDTLAANWKLDGLKHAERWWFA